MLSVLLKKQRESKVLCWDRRLDADRVMGTDSQRGIQAGTDSVSDNRQEWSKTWGEQSRKLKSGLILGQMAPRGSTLLISVLNVTLMHYWRL